MSASAAPPALLTHVSSPAEAIARCGEVLAALASPPGLECATPAKLWPPTPLLDYCKLSSPMILAPHRRSDPAFPEMILLSPPGLDCDPSVATAHARPPGVLEEAGVTRKTVEKPAAQVAYSTTKAEKPKKGKGSNKVAALPVGKQTGGASKAKAKAASSEPRKKEAGRPGPGHSAKAKPPAIKEADALDYGDGNEAAPVPSLPDGGAPCCLCDEIVLALPENRQEASHCFIDGRLVCQQCRYIFNPSGFVPTYHVCINPLCRRKWKQLTPKVLPHFCPPCKRQLEETCVVEAHSLDTGLAGQMYQRWYSVFAELAEALGYPEPPPLYCDSAGSSTQPERAPADSEEARDRWRRLLSAFQRSFPAAPNSEDVRNWNSVHGRKTYYRGVVSRGHRRFVVTVEAEMELNEDLATKKRIEPGMREYHVLDWHGHLSDGQEVVFIAFPNPSVTERDRVSRIVRVLTLPKAAGAFENGTEVAEVATLERNADAGSVIVEATLPSGGLSAFTTDEVSDPSPLGFTPKIPTCVSAPATLVHPKASPGKSDAKQPSVSPDAGGNLSETQGPADAGTNRSSFVSPSSAFADTAFADLMMWSEDQDFCPEAEPSTASKPLAAVAEGKGRTGSPPLISGSSPGVAQAKAGSGAPVGPGAKSAGRGKTSPQTPMVIPANGAPPGKGTPMICPRSPYASYFDD